MNSTLYNEINKFIREFDGLSIDCLSELIKNYPSISKDTLASILSYEFQNRMKAIYVKNSARKQVYWDEYTSRLERFEEPGIIIRMAKNERIAPCLIAKLILQVFFAKCNENDVNVNSYMQNTSLIPDMDLAYEIFLCNNFDNLYSPVATTIRNSIGQQYEIRLHKEATKLGLAFRDEEYLRKYGYDKTPDIKLEVPISIDGFIVNWIESKALFGTEGVHKEYTTNQYNSYWNRFGGGLVIYWFGYVETIKEKNNRFLVYDHLPTEIVQIPTV